MLTSVSIRLPKEKYFSSMDLLYLQTKNITEDRIYLVIIYLILCHCKYQEDVVLHNFINQLTESRILLEKRKSCISSSVANDSLKLS